MRTNYHKGFIAFAAMSVLALIPVGLNTHKQSIDQARALMALNRVAIALTSSRFTGIVSQDANYAFPQFFSDSPNPVTDPTKYWVRQSTWWARFYLLEDGTLRLKSANNGTGGKENFPKAVLYIEVNPPGSTSDTAGNNTFAGPITMYATVVWPYLPASDDAAPINRADISTKIGSRRFLETLVSFTPEPR